MFEKWKTERRYLARWLSTVGMPNEGCVWTNKLAGKLKAAATHAIYVSSNVSTLVIWMVNNNISIEVWSRLGAVLVYRCHPAYRAPVA